MCCTHIKANAPLLQTPRKLMTAASGSSERTYFDEQRDALVGEIASVSITHLAIPVLTRKEPRGCFAEHQQAEPRIRRRDCGEFFSVCQIFYFRLILDSDTGFAPGQVGNEFSAVEALWSQFENVMARDEEADKAAEHEGDENDDEDGGADETQTEQDHVANRSDGRR